VVTGDGTKFLECAERRPFHAANDDTREQLHFSKRNCDHWRRARIADAGYDRNLSDKDLEDVIAYLLAWCAMKRESMNRQSRENSRFARTTGGWRGIRFVDYRCLRCASLARR